MRKSTVSAYVRRARDFTINTLHRQYTSSIRISRLQSAPCPLTTAHS
jgi:hypothetical protein